MAGIRFNPHKAWSDFSIVPNWLMRRSEVTARAQLCYARLSQYAGENGLIFPKQETLAKELAVSTVQVKRLIKELKDHKLLEMTDRHGQRLPSYYHFITHEWMPQDTLEALGDFEQGIMDDTLSGIMDDTLVGGQSIMDDTLVKEQGIMDDTLSGIMDDTLSGIMDDTLSGIMDDTLSGIMDDTSKKKREKIQEKIQEENQEKIHTGSSAFAERPLIHPSQVQHEKRKDRDPRKERFSPDVSQLTKNKEYEVRIPLAGKRPTAETREKAPRLSLEALEEERRRLVQQSKKTATAASRRLLDEAPRKSRKKHSDGTVTVRQHLEEVWTEEFHKLYPAEKRFPWDGKAKGQIKTILDTYSASDIELSMKYFIRNWETLKHRFFKGSGTFPGVGALVAVMSTIVREATKWRDVMPRLEEFEKWRQDHPQSNTVAMPPALQRRYFAIVKELKEMGLDYKV
jgi:hypothetical protein